MKVILLLSCIAVLSCADNRPQNEATETVPAAATDSPRGHIAPVDPAMPGDTDKALTDSLPR